MERKTIYEFKVLDFRKVEFYNEKWMLIFLEEEESEKLFEVTKKYKQIWFSNNGFYRFGTVHKDFLQNNCTCLIAKSATTALNDEDLIIYFKDGYDLLKFEIGNE